MALRFLSDVLLKLQLRSIIVAPVTASLEFFTDNICHNASVTMRTNTNVFLGRCGDINGVNSVNASMLDRGCMVIVYPGPSCPARSGTLIEFGTCMTMAVRSFEVDCPLINGTLEGTYTTYSASSGETQLPSSLVPTSASSSPSFQQESTTAIQSTASSPTASTFDLEASISSLDSSSMVPSSLPSLIPSSTELQSTSSSTAPSSPSDATGGSGNEVGGNKTEIIILSVVIPVIVIAAVMIGCWWRRWWKPHKQAASGDGTMKDHFVPQPEDRSSVDITDRGTTIRSGGSESDPRSSISDFKSLPPYPQSGLVRLDNMNSIPERIVRNTTGEAEGD